MPEERSIEEYLGGLTDRARLFAALQEQRLLKCLQEFRRAIENGEDPDGL